MSEPGTIDDLSGIEVEHLVGAASGLPLVRIRALGPGLVLVGQVDPAGARQIASHLMEGAARAEYEIDMITGLTETGQATPALFSTFLQAVRRGETARMVKTQGMNE